MRWPVFAVLVSSFSVLAAEKARLVQPQVYVGMCDASAGVAIQSNLFLVANDEDNVLRLYRSDQPGPPAKTFDMNGFLELTGKSQEADLEGAAMLGHRVFWIGSHGRNKDGKPRPNRCRLFATDVSFSNAEVNLTPVGRPCKSLLEDLNRDARFKEFHLSEAAIKAPKERDALNIEGLAATPQGHLLIGFRNPTPGDAALVIPLLNPNEVIDGQAARFDAAIKLDLDGLGIRDLAFDGKTYFIIGGEWHSGGDFQLYRWAGPGASPKRIKVAHLNRYSPEAIVLYPSPESSHRFQILSDDGTRPVEGVSCKELSDPEHQTFRSCWVKFE
jgi:hypothetical protein